MSVKWPTIAVIVRGDGPQVRREGGRLGPPFGRVERTAVGDDRPERLGARRARRGRRWACSMIHRLLASASSLVAPHAVMPWPPRMTPTASGWRVVDRGDVETELEPGASPRHPHDPVAVDVLGQLLAVDGGGDGDAAVGVEVVDVGGVDEAVHRGVDRRRRAALAVEAEVEGGDHLVLALLARVHVDEGPQAVEPQDRQPGGGEGAEIAAGTLDPQQLDVVTGDGIQLGALRRRVAAGVVGVAWDRTPRRFDRASSCSTIGFMSSPCGSVEVEDLVEGAHLPVGGGSSSRKYGCISACQRSFTGSDCIAATASSSVPGVSK